MQTKPSLLTNLLLTLFFSFFAISGLVTKVNAADSTSYADKCKGVVCKSNEECRGDGNCVWVGNASDDNIPGYVCTKTNCPSPAFYCQSANNCLDAKGYSGGKIITQSSSTLPPEDSDSWQSICEKSGGEAQPSGICTFGTVVTCAGPGLTVGGNPCDSVGLGTSTAGNCGNSNMIRCQCGNSWVGGSRDLGCFNLCKAAGLPCEPGKVCSTSPKEPVGGKNNTTVVTKPKTTPALNNSCRSIRVFKDNRDFTNKLSELRLGDKVEFRSLAPKTSKIKSMTFQITQDNVILGTYIRTVTSAGTSLMASYEHTLTTPGKISVKVISLNK